MTSILSASALTGDPVQSYPLPASAPHTGAEAGAMVFVVDADATVRDALELLIESAGWQVETFPSGEEFMARACALAPSCLVLDVELPGLSGLDLQKRVADRTDMPVLFLSAHADVATTVQAMKAGAAEFLTKPCKDDVLVDALRDALDRSRAAQRQQAEMRGMRSRYASLSPRERQVLALVVHGRLNKQVAAELGISEVTVKAHRGRVMHKMHAESLPDLVTMAARLAIRRDRWC